MSAPGRGGWRLLRPVAAAHRAALWRLAAWSALGALPVLLSGRLVALAADRGFLAGDAAFGLAMLGCYGAALVLGAYATRQAFGPMADLVEAVRDHVLRGAVSGGLHAAVHGERPPDTAVVSRITSQSERVRQILSVLLLSLSTTVFAAGAAVAGLWHLAPVLVLVTLPAAALACAALVPLSRRWRRRYEASLRAEEELAEECGRTLEGMRDVVACAATARAEADLDQALRRHAGAAAAVAWLSGARVAVLALSTRLPLAALLLLAPSLVSSGALTAGELLGAATYLVSGLEPAMKALVHSAGNLGLELATLLHRLAAHGAPPPGTAASDAGADTGSDTGSDTGGDTGSVAGADTASGEEPGGDPAPACGRRTRGCALTLHDVTFRYGPHAAPVLDGVRLRVAPGEHVALVGPSGTGKSTLALVLAGLARPERGEVRLGSAALPGLDQAWLRRAVALVPQEAYVFAGTVRENLAYLAPGAGDADLDRAVAALGLGPLLHRLGGYDAPLAGPGALSAGERQLLTLARVYASPARVVILDEATCHLDPATEERVENAFARREGTLVVIAHRISSALRAERVLVLDGARLRAGRHEELLATSPLYADLVGYWQAVS